ncbi:type I methionyl aminopeptidase [Azospirillum thermophilum]|uniref:Methionine aminopeptidase n=1 Tax=Azospirillum thermophilum TaxID=2202148 RepID=A0A2S2CRW5_9PROT|nr:type I methionyl aminopeptidase [Azospirillum thermophilum]AWK87165.1 type I methionyl aminopeptidase [Azospirillum thermophilum]
MAKKDERQIVLHGPEAFEAIRKAGRLAAATLDYITDFVVPGVSTAHLDQLVETFQRDHGGIPATIGYHGYTKACCISPNHVVTHGIPSDDKRLADGDIVNIDVTVILDGWYGDTSRMFFVGDRVGVKARKLVDVTYRCMMAGIAAARPGARLGDIGHAIQTLAEANRYTVVRDYGGHGIGQVFHDAPHVDHFGKPGTGVELKPGMVFTIEPMLNAGKADVKLLSDGWTVVTRDRSLSAQFEHQIGITEDGCEIFTLSPAGYTQPPYERVEGAAA